MFQFAALKTLDVLLRVHNIRLVSLQIKRTMNFFLRNKTLKEKYWQRCREMGHLIYYRWSNGFLEGPLAIQIQKGLTTCRYLPTQLFHSCTHQKIFTDLYHVPGSVLSIFLPGSDMKMEAQRSTIVYSGLHSSDMWELIFKPKPSKFQCVIRDPGEVAI